MDESDYEELQQYRRESVRKKRKKEKQKNFFSSIFSILSNKKIRRIVLIVFILIIIAVVALGVRAEFFTESKTTKMGFEDIGELATESCTMTEIDVVDKSRKLYGVNIPFTQTKYIYSYDVNIRAGIDFSKVTWKDNDNNTITVTMPKVKVLGKPTLDTSSFKVYHEKESVFTNVTLEENNKAQNELVEKAKKDAIDNGLYDRARVSAEKQLESFIKANDTYKNYKISFE